MKLYELTNEYVQALDYLTDPENDIPDDVAVDTLDGLSGEFREKSINVALYIGNLESLAREIKLAEDHMTSRRKNLEKQAFRLRDYLKNQLEATGINKITCPYFDISVQNNPGSVNIVDELKIPDCYIQHILTTKIDKAAIRDIMKSGVPVSGAEFVKTTRLTIK